MKILLDGDAVDCIRSAMERGECTLTSIWTGADVQACASRIGIEPLTPKEVRASLEYIADEYSACDGVSCTALETAICAVTGNG